MTAPNFERAYDRAMLRTAFVSLFWGVIAERKKRPGGYTLQALARALGANKAEVSRWFNSEPNWTINTIAGIANALDLDIEIRAVERKTGAVFTPAGLRKDGSIQSSESNTSSSAKPLTMNLTRAPSGQIETIAVMSTQAA